jgi:hypothetical protein
MRTSMKSVERLLARQGRNESKKSGATRNNFDVGTTVSLSPSYVHSGGDLGILRNNATGVIVGMEGSEIIRSVKTCLRLIRIV